MVPLDEYEKVQKSFPVPVKINPQVEGVWDWPDPFNAVFTPSDPYALISPLPPLLSTPIRYLTLSNLCTLGTQNLHISSARSVGISLQLLGV